MSDSRKTLSHAINEVNQAVRKLMEEVGLYRLLGLLSAVFRHRQKNNRK